MRGMYRNQRPFWYANFVRNENQTDEDGRYTGHPTPKYTNPVKAWANISTTTGITNNNIAGKTENEHFGINLVYNAVINPMPLSFPMNEYSICWIDREPTIKEDGSTDTPHDHYVHRVATSLNSKAYLLTRVGVNDLGSYKG